MKAQILSSALLAVLVAGCGSARNESGVASQLAQNAPTVCSIQSHFGGYLTPTGGGGQTYDAIHADATQVQAWEKFTLIDTGVGSPINYAIKTSKGYYVTAVGGGGRITDVIHTDTTSVTRDGIFILNALGGGLYTIQTRNGHFLGHAGQVPNVLHSDATAPKSWETFRVTCGI